MAILGKFYDGEDYTIPVQHSRPSPRRPLIRFFKIICLYYVARLIAREKKEIELKEGRHFVIFIGGL